MTTQPKILIVDDVPDNIKLLVNAMARQYELIVADHGMLALQLAEQEQPDLILLDVMMPDMDGYAVCRALQERESTRAIPVIFVTAMGDTVNEMKGLLLGAVDYISKPFCIPIVMARVAAHIALRTAHKKLAQQCAALQEMETLRRDMESIARHDMKSPIDGIISASTFLLQEEPLSRSELDAFLRMIRDAARKLREMVNLSMSLLKMEQGQYQVTLKPINLVAIIYTILTDHGTLLEAKRCVPLVLIDGHPAKENALFTVLGDETLCYTMLANLFRNAVEASGVGDPVEISLQRNGQTTIAIHNQGMVPSEIQEHFFDKYVTHGKRDGTGLGTYSARLMVEVQRGQIQMHTSAEEGTTVTIVLPEAGNAC
ncbi:MAG: hybrid sensor histidine kinase/response regulator [Magnetococcus sp. YQC-3]